MPDQRQDATASLPAEPEPTDRPGLSVMPLPPASLHTRPTVGTPVTSEVSEAITPEQAREAFAVLGLDPAADGDLVDLAYWHHVDVCRAALLGSPAWRQRMAELNQARALLSHIVPAAGAILDEPDNPSAGGPSGAPRVAAALLPPVALMLFIGITRSIGWDQGAIAAGGFALLALTAFAALAVTAVGERRRPTATQSDPNPYRRLRVLPSADQALVTIAYRHLLRVASARGDVAALNALEAAYARVGTPAARTAYDLRAAETDALMLAEPVRPAEEPRPVPRLKPGWRGWFLTAVRAVRHRWHKSGPRRRERTRPVASWEALDGEASPPAPRRNPELPATSIGTLRVLEADGEIMTVVLRDGMVYAVGSAPDADVRLPAAADVAPEHARLTVRRGRVLFHHIAAGMDSHVNGERVIWAVLEPGDTLRIGAYRCQYLTATAEPRPPTFLRDLPHE